MRKALFFIFILISGICYGGGWGFIGENSNESPIKQDISGTNQSGDGVIIHNNAAPQQSSVPTPGSRGNGFEEADWSIDADVVPAMFADQPSKRQIVEDALIIGCTYKFSNTIHMFVKGAMFAVEGTRKINREEKKNYTNAMLEDPEREDLEEPEPELTEWEHQHLFYGFGLRWNVARTEDETQQIQINAGYGIISSVREKISGESVGNLEPGAMLEFKYLWASDNFAYGIVASIIDMPSLSEEWEYDTNGGYKYIAFTVQMGLPKFN